MSITKERRDEIPQEAIRDAARAMKDRDRIKGVDEYYERLASTAITAAVPHLALDAADREALSSMEEIARLREELEAAEAMIIPNPVAWTSEEAIDLMSYRGADTPYEAYIWSEPTIAHNIPLYRRASVAKTVACGGCGTSDPESRCIGCLHDFYAAPPVSDPVAWQYRDRRLADPTWHYVPDADFREAIGMHPKIYEVRPLYAAPPAASLELAKSALQDYPIGRVLPLSTEGAMLAVEPVKVKPLEWSQNTGPWASRAGEFGEEYLVTKDYDTDDWVLSIETFPKTIIGTFSDKGYAKTAAQERHEARIRSALILPAP